MQFLFAKRWIVELVSYRSKPRKSTEGAFA